MHNSIDFVHKSWILTKYRFRLPVAIKMMWCGVMVFLYTGGISMRILQEQASCFPQAFPSFSSPYIKTFLMLYKQLWIPKHPFPVKENFLPVSHHLWQVLDPPLFPSQRCTHYPLSPSGLFFIQLQQSSTHSPAHFYLPAISTPAPQCYLLPKPPLERYF